MQASPSFHEALRADMRALQMRSTHLLAMFVALFAHPGFLAIFLYRLSVLAKPYGLVGRVVSKFLWRLNILLTGCYLPSKAVIGAGFAMPHATGIVIGEGVRIGENVTIYQNVTLGQSHAKNGNAQDYPTIHDDVTIFAGAVIIGNAEVGSGARIGANTVVTDNVPQNMTAVGIPARVLPASSAAINIYHQEQDKRLASGL